MDRVGRLPRNESSIFANNPDKRPAKFIDEYDVIENGNCYVDQLLESLIGNAETGFDPYCLKDYILKIAFVKAGLYNGKVTGLKTLHRTNDCYLTKTYRRLHIAADIGASDVNIMFEVRIELQCVTLKFALNLHFGHIQIITHLSVFANSGRDADIYQFQIEDMHDVVPSISIYKPLDWLLNKAVRATAWFLSTPIKRTLSNLIKRQIQYGLSSYQFPVEVLATFDESSETTGNSLDNGLSAQGSSVESSKDSKVQSGVVTKEDSSKHVFLSTLDKFRLVKAGCEDIVKDGISPEIAFQSALKEFRRSKPSYEIL